MTLYYKFIADSIQKEFQKSVAALSEVTDKNMVAMVVFGAHSGHRLFLSHPLFISYNDKLKLIVL